VRNALCEKNKCCWVLLFVKLGVIFVVCSVFSKGTFKKLLEYSTVKVNTLCQFHTVEN
jgi:hypothetical protein